MHQLTLFDLWGLQIYLELRELANEYLPALRAQHFVPDRFTPPQLPSNIRELFAQYAEFEFAHEESPAL